MSNNETAVFITSNSTETLEVTKQESTHRTVKEVLPKAPAMKKPLFHDVLDLDLEADLIASLAEFIGTMFFIFMALTAVQVFFKPKKHQFEPFSLKFI